jgi:hypothetical protein
MSRRASQRRAGEDARLFLPEEMQKPRVVKNLRRCVVKGPFLKAA